MVVTPTTLYNNPNLIDWDCPIVVDFETYYDKDYSLKKLTVERYVRGDEFECIGVAIKVGEADTRFYKGTHGVEILRQLMLCKPKSPFVMHNSTFDAAILAFRYDLHPNFIVDTMVLAKLTALDRVAGGANLAALGEFLRGKGLIPAGKGTTVQDMLGVHACDMSDEQWQAYGEYCYTDVDITYAAYKLMMHKATRPPVSELIMADVTTKMFTKPAFEVDAPLLEQYAVKLKQERQEKLQKLANSLGYTDLEALQGDLRSANKFASMLERLGVTPPRKISPTTGKETYAFAKTDKPLLDLLNSDNELVSLLVRTRVGTASNLAMTRTQSFLDIAKRGTFPVALIYASAHTGRYGAGTTGAKSSTNVQNLPKRTGDTTLRRSLKALSGHVVLATDSSGIEMRLNAYIAGQTDVMDVFLGGKDPYIDMATAIVGKSYDEIAHEAKVLKSSQGKKWRNLGKECCLSCGYGMSAATFEYRMTLAGNQEAAKDAQRLVNVYRQKNNMIVQFWKTCDTALSAMYNGQQFYFGGMDNNLFLADGASEFFGRRIPSILLPNGTRVFYENLRKEMGDDGREQYVYDQFRGRGYEPKRIWGSALDENLCIAEDTLVLTDNGWKKIQDITNQDKVHDGVEFVTHGGLVFKSAKACVKVDGVYMTKDHEVLTDDGWKTAEVHLSTGEASQLSRFDFSKVWQANCYQSDPLGRKKMALGFPVRLWKHSKQNGLQGEKNCKKGWNTPLWLQCVRACIKQTKFTWVHRTPDLLDMAKYESSLFKSKPQGLEKLWWQGYNCVRTMVRFQGVLSRYVTELSTRVGFRPQRQQFGVLQGELSLGYTTGKLQQQTQQCTHTGWRQTNDGSRVLQGVRTQPHNGTLSVIAGGNNATTGGETKCKKAVYDILNCGSRNRFVVKGQEAPFVVHNCQALAFDILKYQAIEIAKRSVPIHMNVHDEWVSVVPETHAAYAAHVHYHCMHSVPNYIQAGLLDCEVDVGRCYGDTGTLDMKQAYKESK